MLLCHHWEANGASARVLIALAEKGLAYQSRYVDALAREQHEPAFVALNPTGELPVLVANGTPMNESSYICEYLEEAYPQPPLMPADAHGRWAVRGWQKFVDDYYASAVSDLAWNAYRARVDGEQVRAGAQSAPTHERRQVWEEHAAPFPPERMEKGRDYIVQAMARMDEALEQGPWLAGGAFTLADIAMYAWTAYLPRIAPDMVSPAVSQWLDRVERRPAVQAAAKAGRTGDPYGIAAPGPEHTRWG